MRRFLFKCFILPLLVYTSSCAHVHTSVAANVNDMGERIRTKNKYRVNTVEALPIGVLHYFDKTTDFAKWQPDVFDANGVPVTFLEKQVVERHVEERKAYGGPVMLLSAMSCFIVPMVTTSHVHETWPFRINGERGDRVSFEACIHTDVAWGIPPLRWLLCWWDTGTCYSGRRTFDSHVMDANSDTFIDDEVQKRAMAYGLAVRLKELEDSGQIGDDMVVNGIASIETTAKNPFEIPIEIAWCENTTGRDFEYDFVLRSKGGGKLKLVDYGRIRSAFRVAIVNMYCMKHPEANPRSIVTDFTRYAMSGDRVEGRVSVLTIEVTTAFYDAATRTGRMSARIAANQFEDVRRFIRNHIEELAARSNIVFDGDALPPGARFYTRDERLAENGVLEVDFKTE